MKLERGPRTESRPNRTTERGKEVAATRTSYADRIDTLIDATASIGGNCAPQPHYNMRSIIINDEEYLYTQLWNTHCYLSTIPRPLAEPTIFDYGWRIDDEGWVKDQEESRIRKYGSEVKFKAARIDLVIKKQSLGDCLSWLSEEKHALGIHPGYRSNSDKEKDKRDGFLDGL